MSEMQIQSVTFRPDDLIEIAFLELRDQADAVGRIQIVVVEKNAVADLATGVIEDLEELVDTAMRLLDDTRKD